jgi:xanthine dehydrogenase iron-sulfur cluster and FAD-binding subunit A
MRTVPISEFFVGYRKVDMLPTEVHTHTHTHTHIHTHTHTHTHKVLRSVLVPTTTEWEFCESYKQAKRRDDDISIVSCCLRVRLKLDEDRWV